MNYIVVGLNHKTSSIGTREKLSFNKQGCQKILTFLTQDNNLHEAAVLSTCNRVELYGASSDPEKAKKTLCRTLIGPQKNNKELQKILYKKTDQEAVKHLFEVTSSLDSQVVGENQITNQVKEAYDLARTTQSSGSALNRLFEKALYVSKRIKTETEISKGNKSIGSAAVMLAKKIFGSLKECSVLLLGTGEIGKHVASSLVTCKVQNIYLLNRTFDKAQELEALGLGTACSLDLLPSLLDSADIVISATSEPHPEFGKKAMLQHMKNRKNKPLFAIDLGVPRNMPSELDQIDNLYLYNIDNLQQVIEETNKNQDFILEKAKNIIEEEVGLFYDSALPHDVRPAISEFGNKLERIRKTELDKTLLRMAHLSEKDTLMIEKLTKAIVGKILKDPVLSLREQKDIAAPEAISLFKKLFKLEEKK